MREKKRKKRGVISQERPHNTVYLSIFHISASKNWISKVTENAVIVISKTASLIHCQIILVISPPANSQTLSFYTQIHVNNVVVHIIDFHDEEYRLR